MTRKIWVRTPTAGGSAIPEGIQRQTEQRLQQHAQKFFQGKYTRIDVRFRGKFCYVDAFTEPDAPARMSPGSRETRAEYLERLRSSPIHLCRLRYFDTDRWSFAVYTYSHERYEDSCFPSGDFFGPAEDAFDLAANLYLS